MDEVKMKLSQEHYEFLKDKTHKEISDWLEARLHPSVIHGYGYYGHMGIIDKDGEHYLVYRIGSSCD